MAVKKPPARAVRTAAPVPPISIGAPARPSGTRVGLWLSLYLRAVAVLWLAEGLLLWAAVLSDASGTLVDHASPLRMAGLFFFCVLDFVAVVGLWLITTWGAAVWIATIVGHMLAAAFAPGFLPDPTLTLASDLLLVGLYAALAILGAREEKRRR